MRMRGLAAGIIAGVLAPAMAFGFTGVFRSAYTELGASTPTGVAVGDFDADGTLDVVTTNAGLSSNALTPFIGFDDGTITQLFGSEIELGSFPSALVKGKFDGDDIDDVVVAKANDNSVVFLKGLANQSFFALPGAPIGVGQSPAGIAAQDFTGDGELDLVVANEGGDSTPGSVSILRGNGQGGFVLIAQPDPDEPGSTVDHLPAELGTLAVAIGNIDGNPALDIVAANSRSNTLSVYLGEGDGVFTPADPLPTGGGPQDVALADLNQDGRLDLMVATSTEDHITVQFGNGDGTFGAGQALTVGNTPTRLTLGDIDGNGLLDIVVSNRRSGDVSVLRATAPGLFAPTRTFVADAEPGPVALGDFNDDTILDVVAATEGSESGATVAILRTREDGGLHAVEDIPAGIAPTDVTVADVDGDGTPDLLVSADGGAVRIFYGASNQTEPTLLDIGGRVLSIVSADLDGDRLPDLIAADGVNNRIAVIRSLGARRFAAPVFYPTADGSPGAVAIGDFDGNGRPDIAATTIGSERFCQGGPRNGQSCAQEIDCAPNGICAAPGEAAVLLQQANGTFGPARTTEVEETPIGLAVVDANCDRRDDLVVANLASSTVMVLRSNGDGTFAVAQTLPEGQVGRNPIRVVAADFDRDNVRDFAVTNTVAPGAQHNVHLFRGVCAAPFAPFQNGSIRAGELASAIVARDFTGDQIVDLAIVSQTSNSVYLVRGIGNGTLSLLGSDLVSRMPIAITGGDFDLDGRYDAATANNDPSANNLSVLSNCGGDPGCHHFGQPLPIGPAARRADANDDGFRTAADLVALGAEIADGDGVAVESIGLGSYTRAAPGADANGDGRVDPQDAVAIAHRIFGGG